jgi:oxygen-independent coproporphyrinogen-3 oxidase
MEISPKTQLSYIKNVMELGINRFSVGVQSFHPELLSILGREHHAQESHSILASLQECGADNINIDLIYGLAAQSQQMALEDLQFAFKAGIEHLSWYELMLEPNTQFARKPELKTTPALLEQIEEEGSVFITEQGFKHYEVSAYCRTRPSLHNSHYWQYGDYLGIGAGAHSKITTQPRRTIRLHKTRYPKDYLNAPRVLLEAVNDEALDYLLNRLRLFNKIFFTEILDALPLKTAQSILDWLQDQSSPRTLISVYTDHFILTSRGQLLINDILYNFQEWRQKESAFN